MAITEDKTSSDLPIEVIETILSKLPSKSLLRFKTVSKSWNTIISDPLFVETHLHNSPNNIFLCTDRNRIQGGFSLFKLQGGKVHDEQVLKRPSGLDIICCECNGVLLLSEHYCSKEYMLWNPSTRREMYFRSPHDNGIVNHGNGICYDSVTDDFKVVFIGKRTYAIYSCKNNSWTEKKLLETLYNGISFSGIYVDGTTYWVLIDDNNTKLIAYFDPRIDELRRLQMPEQVSDYSSILTSVACLRSNLCLYCLIRDRDGDDDKTKIQIWIKEKDIDVADWKELITFENSKSTRNWWTGLLCFVENKILIRSDLNRFVYYSPSEKTFEYSEKTKTGGRFVPYRNSLYFPTRSIT